jgi:hypothetical protein
VTAIGIWAFYGCTSLTSVELPASVSSFGSSAFASCDKLTTVKVGWSQPPVQSSGSGAWFGYSYESLMNITLIVPPGAKSLYEAADYWKDFGKIIEDN